MEWARGFLKKRVYLVLAVLLVCSTPVAGAAAATLTVNVNQSLNVEADQVTKASIANPEIADLVVISAQELVLIGKKPGDTTLRIWTANGSRYTYEVHVGNQNNAGASEVAKLLGYKGVRVSIVGNTVMLEGSVRDQNERLRAEKVAAAYAEKVVNLLEITHPKQVRLEVRVLEISSTKAKQVGIQFGNTVTSEDGSVTVGSPGIFLLGQGMSNSSGHSWGGLGSYVDIGTTVSALIQNGDAELLSSPSIVTMSGEKANILIGGELPIPVAYENGKFSVEWKEYGIKLNIEPLVDSKDRIHSTVKAEVSNIDSTSSYAVSIPNTGYHIPALRSRRAESVVEMSSGATMAIGGLISSEEGRQISKIPLLGDLPILGQFFRHTQNSKERREIVILVTPYLTSENEVPKMSAPMRELNKKAKQEEAGSETEDAEDKAVGNEAVGNFKTRIQSILREEDNQAVKPVVSATVVPEIAPAKKLKAAEKTAARSPAEVKTATVKETVKAEPVAVVKPSAAKDTAVSTEAPGDFRTRIQSIVKAENNGDGQPTSEPTAAKPEPTKDKTAGTTAADGFKTRIQAIVEEENRREAQQAAELSTAAKAVAAKKAAAAEKAAQTMEPAESAAKKHAGEEVK